MTKKLQKTHVSFDEINLNLQYIFLKTVNKGQHFKNVLFKWEMRGFDDNNSHNTKIRQGQNKQQNIKQGA